MSGPNLAETKQAIEVETGKSDAVYNIRKDLGAGFNQVICFALNEKIKKQIMLELNKLTLKNDKSIKLMNFVKFF